MAFGKEDGNTSDDSVCHTIVESRDLLYTKLPQPNSLSESESSLRWTVLLRSRAILTVAQYRYRYVHC